jgi:hypothetical protein
VGDQGALDVDQCALTMGLAKMIRTFALGSILVVLATGATASQPLGTSHVEIPTVDPRPEDVSSIDGMINAWYDVLNGPAGQPRQWARDKTLYIPEIRFVSTWTEGKSVETRIRNHQAYVDAVNAELSKGFFEREIHRVTEQYGSIAHVWSTYESRETENGPVTARGINSIELFWDGKRWWIANGIWADEPKNNPIPSQYLPGGR